MTRSEFLTAAAKGQGRAVSALRNGEFRASLHDMRRLVVHWPGFDYLFDASRGWYTIELMDASGYREELTDLAILHLPRSRGYWQHRREIVFELARRGSLAAKEALHASYSPDNDFRFADQIIELDGLAGMEWLILHSDGYLVQEHRGRLRGWTEDLKELLGDEPVKGWLIEASDRPEFAEFARLVNLVVPHKPQAPFVQEPFEVARQAWRRPYQVRRWLWSASEEEQEKAWRAFDAEEDPETLRCLARGLRGKLGHCDVEHVIARARAWEDKENPFAYALEELVDPRVRQLGFDLVDSGWVLDGISLIATNAQPGDEQLMLASVMGITDDEELHCVTLDLLRMCEDLDKAEILIWIYEQNPCSFCRESAVRDLVKKSAAPEWLLRECLLDSVADTREMAETALGIRPSP